MYLLDKGKSLEGKILRVASEYLYSHPKKTMIKVDIKTGDAINVNGKKVSLNTVTAQLIVENNQVKLVCITNCFEQKSIRICLLMMLLLTSWFINWLCHY